jgi:cytidine deaminase
VCAERVAIYSAITAGARQVTAIVLTAARSRPVSPCGACRQVMAEFMAPDALVWSDCGDGQPPVAWRVDALLPSAFLAQALGAPPRD